MSLSPDREFWNDYQDISPLRSNNESSPKVARNSPFLTPNATFIELESDESTDEDELTMTEKLEKKRQRKANLVQHPMSSPARKEKPKFQSKALGEKYTLRSRNYIPFNSKQRDERRNKKALEKRGGMDQMEKFLLFQEEKENLKRLEQEAYENGYESEFEFEEPDDHEKYEDYIRELQEEIEEVDRLEDEELDELFKVMKL